MLIHSFTHTQCSATPCPMPAMEIIIFSNGCQRLVGACVCVCVELRNKRKERRLLTLNLGKLSCGAKWELKSKKKIKIPISKQAALIMYTSIYLSKWTNCWLDLDNACACALCLPPQSLNGHLVAVPKFNQCTKWEML